MVPSQTMALFYNSNLVARIFMRASSVTIPLCFVYKIPLGQQRVRTHSDSQFLPHSFASSLDYIRNPLCFGVSDSLCADLPIGNACHTYTTTHFMCAGCSLTAWAHIARRANHIYTHTLSELGYERVWVAEFLSLFFVRCFATARVLIQPTRVPCNEMWIAQ